MPEAISQLLNSSSKIRRGIYDNAAGISSTNYQLMKRAIVLDVKRGVTDDPVYNAKTPPYSVKAAIIGEDAVYGNEPQNALYGWYKPLMSLHNISIPEIGEEVLIIREFTAVNSTGYWISRVNETNKVSSFLSREYSNAPNNIKYGFDFDVRELNNSGPVKPNKIKGVNVLPSKLGDVVLQGRSGTFLRQSFNPNDNKSLGVLEMGLMEDREYGNNDKIATIGKTRTKTLHMRGKISDFSSYQKKTTTETRRIGPFPDGSFQNVPVNIAVTPKNFIANVAEEFYNISTSRDSQDLLYREVLGEKLESYQKSLNEKINDLIDTIDEFVNTTSEFLEEFLDHKHVLPEINIQLPDKEVSFTENIRQPSRLVPAGERTINISGVPVTETINTPVGPKKVTKFVGGQTIKVRNPPRLINGRIKTVTKKKTIKFDAITIGGERNKRVTTSPTTTQRTQFITDNITELFTKFRKSGDDILSLTEETRDFLSKTHFIN